MKLLKHSFYNLIGLGAPLLVAVFSIPMLINELGAPRFGLLTMIWAVVSYFGLFDLGLGRALTQQIAAALANGERDRVGPVAATAIAVMAALGVAAGVLMAVSASWGVSLIQLVPDRNEAVNAVYAMALAMPAIVLTSGFRGILEAKHAFGIVNLIRLPMGLFTFLGPLVLVIYGHTRLDWIAALLAGGRIVACTVHVWFAWRELPEAHGAIVVQRRLLRPLCTSGGWLTVSNVISPFMGYADRFVIGALISTSAVTYYVTPHELVTKLWIVPGALTAVLFPTFATHMTHRDKHAWDLFKKSISWLYIIMLPITAALALFADSILSFWISPGFAQQSTALLQIFAMGMFFGCLAQIPFTAIQSADRSDVTAMIHCVELPFFLLILWWLTSLYGALGAATAWMLRVVLDTALMFWASLKILNKPAMECLIRPSVRGGGVVALCFSGVLLPDGILRMLWIFAIVGTVFICRKYVCAVLSQN